MKSLIYVGMDVHKESYSLCCYLISSGEFVGETKIEAKSLLVKEYLEVMTKWLKEEKGFDNVEFVAGYEAGCLGFSLYKDLTKYGIICKIVAPSTLEKAADSNVKKNDRRDARMIARNLAYGSCKYVHIPDEIDLETKEYIRMRTIHKKAVKRIKQQILAFCLRCGQKYTGQNYWTVVHMKWLRDLELPGLYREILDEYLDTHDRAIEKLNRLEGKILERSNLERYKKDTDNLNCMKGISKQGALTIISEVGDFKRFATPNEFCAYLGLVPGERSSAGKGPNLGITKLGNGLIRTQLIESCQIIVKGHIGKKTDRILTKQAGQDIRVIAYCDRAVERLMKRYQHLLFRGVVKNKAITAIARELACFVWGIMNNRLDGRVIGGNRTITA